MTMIINDNKLFCDTLRWFIYIYKLRLYPQSELHSYDLNSSRQPSYPCAQNKNQLYKRYVYNKCNVNRYVYCKCYVNNIDQFNLVTYES